MSDALYVLGDQSFGVSGQAIAPIRNVSAGWIRIRPTASRYTILATNGAILFRNTFEWSYPSDLGPGDHGYLATSIQFPKGKAADVGRIVVELSFAPIDQSATVALALRNLVTRDYSESGIRVGVVTSGTVTNPSSKSLRGYDVGAFYFDAKARFLGYTSLNPGPLRAHQTTKFLTLPMAARTLRRATIARIEVFPAAVCNVCAG
jgi:hypothetical protein